MAAPKVTELQIKDRVLNQVQSNIVKPLNTLLGKELNNGVLLKSIVLTSGSNTINHTLSRPLVGWFITRCRASATFYDTQDANLTPDRTLILTSSANVTVDIFVF